MCRISISFDTKGNFLYIVTCAGVVKLVDARDSKSRGASTPCRFDSDLRHQFFANVYIFPAISRFSSALTDFMVITGPSKKLPSN